MSKYISIPFVSSTLYDSSNDSETTPSVDIGEYHLFGGYVDNISQSSPSITVQPQISYDPMSVNDTDSSWFSQGTAATVNSAVDIQFTASDIVLAQKMRMVVTRASGSATLGVRVICK